MLIKVAIFVDKPKGIPKTLICSVVIKIRQQCFNTTSEVFITFDVVNHNY